jgi:hypothetical protein
MTAPHPDTHDRTITFTLHTMQNHGSQCGVQKERGQNLRGSHQSNGFTSIHCQAMAGTRRLEKFEICWNPASAHSLIQKRDGSIQPLKIMPQECHGRLCVHMIVEPSLALLRQVLLEKSRSIGQDEICKPISYRIRKQGFSDAMLGCLEGWHGHTT